MDAKSQIDKQKKTVLDQAANKQKQDVEQLRTTATAKREAIAANLHALSKKIDEAQAAERAKISTDRANRVQKIAEDSQKKIASLPAIPKGLSKEETAKLTAERSDAIAKIRGDAKSEQQSVAADAAKKGADLSAGISSLKGSVQGTASLNRDKIASDIKGSLEQARTKYTTLKEAVKAKYESTYQAQYDAIKKNA